jgi:hypothetical protein
MAVIPGQLERAQLENLSADPSNLPEGRIWTNTTSDRAKVVLNSAAEVLVTESQSQTLTNKTLTSPVISQISNSGTLTLPTSTDTLVGRNTTDTLTNKTLTTPIIAQISNSGTLTLPTATDTLVGRTTTDTLTNKTYQDAIIVLDRVSLNQADVATTATITALSTLDPLMRFTGSTATEVQGIDAAGNNRIVTFHNASSAAITFRHQNVGATATNRIITPTGNDLTLRSNESVQWIYDNTQTRWVIGAGSGSGGGSTAFGTFASPRTIAVTGITAALGHMSTTDSNQVIFVTTASGEVNVTANPQIQAGTQVGQVIRIIGTSNDNFITLEDGDGLSLNGNWYSYSNANLTLLWDGVKWTEMGRRDV